MTDEIPLDQSSKTSVEAMLSTLNLTQIDHPTGLDAFSAQSEPMPLGRVFGGQVLAQSVLAASHTVDPGRIAHSMHGYFLRPGDPDREIIYLVDRIYDGRSFTSRRAQAYQDDVPIFSMIASFQHEEDGLEHFVAMPEGIPAPEELPGLADSAALPMPYARRLLTSRPFEIRHVDPEIYRVPDPDPRTTQAVWIRIRQTISDAPVLHQAILAYLSDTSVQEPILRAHGLTWSEPSLKLASLDTALWWHRPGRVDDWLLYVQESPSASGGRGLATGRLYSRDGTLIASVAQEVTIRVAKG